MANDIVLTWDMNLQGCKMIFASNDVVTSQSLLTPVLVSIFTDARAAADDILPDPQDIDRRGSWMDETNIDKPNDAIGSRLWLLEREKATDENALRAKMYIEESLKWMLEEGICSLLKVETEIQWPSQNTPVLAFSVAIQKPDGTKESYKFEAEWRATANAI